MSPRKKTENIDVKTEYVKSVLESITNRRESLENKSSILLASNAILLSVIIGIGVPIVTNGSNQYLIWLRLILATSALTFLVISTLLAANILAPMFSDKQRRKLLEIPATEHNLFWFGKIAELHRDEYLNEISAISKEEILLQFVTESHHLSRILVHRYSILNRAHHCFVISIIIFSILATTKLFTG